MRNFTGYNILITGAASGIGLLMAKNFLKKGANIIAVDINDSGLNNLMTEFGQYKNQIFTYRCDLSKKSEIETVSKEILLKHSKIDILINNAGIVSGRKFLALTDDQIEKTMDINFMANVWLVRAFLPEMLKHDSGQIVFISSAAGIIGVHKLADYSASKFAAFGFGEALRFELAKMKTKIKISIICPYYIKTGMFQGVKSRFAFLLPLLEPEKVALKIVKAVEKKKPMLIMPKIVKLTWIFRVFGIKMFDPVVNLLGVNDTMQHFTGRPNEAAKNDKN